MKARMMQEARTLGIGQSSPSKYEFCRASAATAVLSCFAVLMKYSAGPARTDSRSHTAMPKRKAEQKETALWLSSVAKAIRTRNVCAALLQSFRRQHDLEIGLYKLYQASTDQATWLTLHSWHRCAHQILYAFAETYPRCMAPGS